MSTKLSPNGLTFPMQRGPFQNNGASPWYSTISLGTPGQPLKWAIDSGTNITWSTSTVCPPDQCRHFSDNRFNQETSTTFEFTDCLQRPYSFGPWGTMQIETGVDVLTLPNGTAIPMSFFLAAHYSGDQFRQLDWDAGIGLPSSSAYTEGRSSFLFQELMNAGQIDPKQPYVAFDWNVNKRIGTCTMGSFDHSKVKGPSLFLPWTAYTQIPSVEYIWATHLSSYSVGGEILATDISFALDSGSSQFKGDDRLMQQTLARIAQGHNPDVVMKFAGGEITLGTELYNVLIEEGPQKGETIPQFAPLGLSDLVLVGSLVMEHCYTVHEYQVVQCGPNIFSLAPVGIWLFNRPDGPQIITQSSSTSFIAEPRNIVTKRAVLPITSHAPSASSLGSVAGNWVNEYGSLMSLTVEGDLVSGVYQSSTGSTGQYEVSGYHLEAVATGELGQPVALAIGWHSIDKGQADPSWNWSSSLCGQISKVGKEEVLTLSHLLVASSDFEGVAKQGTYLDKLVYRRSRRAPQLTSLSASSMTSMDNPLEGRWISADGTCLQLRVEAANEGRVGRVLGFMINAQGHAPVSGFTDMNARASGLVLQSLALSTTGLSAALTLCGTLQLENDVLTLAQLTSVPTAPTQTYVQTRLAAALFKRG
ncbi:pepsin-like aspartic protease [Pseudomonas sp. SIMBA_077]